MRAYPCREWNSPRLKPGHTTAAVRVCTAAAAHVLVEFNGDVYESDSCLVETPAFLLFYGETFLCEFWWAFFCFSCYISVDRENSGLVYLLPTGESLLCSNSTLNFLSRHKIVAWMKMRARQSYHHESYGKNLASFTQDDTFFFVKNEMKFFSNLQKDELNVVPFSFAFEMMIFQVRKCRCRFTGHLSCYWELSELLLVVTRWLLSCFATYDKLPSRSMICKIYD